MSSTFVCWRRLSLRRRIVSSVDGIAPFLERS
jgi:hypothetical protein